MSNNTPLFQQHLDAGAKMVDFGGWNMPIHYGSQIEEHHQVRKSAGMFDVSHMTILDMKGRDVKSYLQRMLANDVEKIVSIPGKALYSCLLNDDAGVIDDLIVYHMNEQWFRVIVNASTRDKDIQWFKDHINDDDVRISERTDLAMIAVQGPEARAIADSITGLDTIIKPFTAVTINDYFVARTGYTGEDGYEIMIDNDNAAQLWDQLITAGIAPCGLGARDTLRMEAGMNLYGNDMDETTSPLESGLAWTIDLKNEQRDFIGRQALQQQKQSGVHYKLVGLVLQDKGILRAHQKTALNNQDETDGETTSGGFSPTMNQSIAFARIPAAWTDQCLVEIRNKRLNAKIVKLPFVRQGKILV